MTAFRDLHNLPRTSNLIRVETLRTRKVAASRNTAREYRL